jgi:hypothetical protein
VAGSIDRALVLAIRLARARDAILDAHRRHHIARALSLRTRFFNPDLHRLLGLTRWLESLPAGLLDPEGFDLSGLRTGPASLGSGEGESEGDDEPPPIPVIRRLPELTPRDDDDED